MQISPIPTLSDDINDIRTRTANIVAEKIIHNESFKDDPTRTYRALKFSKRYNFREIRNNLFQKK